jgi:urea transport system permease protein
MTRRYRLATLIALSLALTAPLESAPPTDEELRGALRLLLSADEAERENAAVVLAGSGDPRIAALLDALEAGSVYTWEGNVVIRGPVPDDGGEEKPLPVLDPLTRAPLQRGGGAAVVPLAELKEPELSRRARLNLIRDLKLLLELSAPDAETRIVALQKYGDLRQAKHLPALEATLKTETSAKARYVARESMCLIRLGAGIGGGSHEELAQAARELGEMRSQRGEALLDEVLSEIGKAPDPASLEPLRQACMEARAAIESYHKYVRGFEYLFSGLSLGSILVLMALGLSIIFGLMGVINMAHGELMMIGAYATFEMQQLFVSRLPASAFDWYFIAALPASFLAAALVGFLIEFLVIRHLYGRPLETLLATWGIGLILIQSVRIRYGDNIAVNSPTWLRGGFEVFHDSTLPYNRCYILLLTLLSVALLYAVMNHTRLGLLVRAATQNRETASSLGVNTRRVDGYTFALGAGIAGVAGYALTLIGGVTPDMGQNYVVDSFLVVVTGGVGELAGVICSGLGLGVLNKILEPYAGAVFGKVLILVIVVFFIQLRPAGLFAPKGRLADG